MIKPSDIHYHKKKSKDNTSSVYEIEWKGILAGNIIVPSTKDEKIQFTTYSGISPYYAKRFALMIYCKFKQDIFVKTPRTSFNIGAKDFKPKREKQKKPEVIVWTRYVNTINKYMGKYREFKQGRQVCAEICLKKLVTERDAAFEVYNFLKKYPVVKLTVSTLIREPVEFNDSMSQSEINNIIMLAFTGQKTKATEQKKYTDSNRVSMLKPRSDKPEQTESNNNANAKAAEQPVQQTPQHIDPMVLSKTLTLMMGQKQTEKSAKEKAQQTANTQYVAVKLLSPTGMFIGNFYPQEEVINLRLKRLTEELKKREQGD